MENKDYDNIEEYMAYFKQQPLKEKQKIVIEHLQLLNTFTNKLCEELYMNKEDIKHKELDDLNKEDYSQDDFAEAVMILIDSIQNSVCDYSMGITDTLNYIESLSDKEQ